MCTACAADGLIRCSNGGGSKPVGYIGDTLCTHATNLGPLKMFWVFGGSSIVAILIDNVCEKV